MQLRSLIVVAIVVVPLSGCAKKPRVVPPPAAAISPEVAVDTVVRILGDRRRYRSLPTSAAADVRTSWVDVSLNEKGGMTTYRVWLDAPITQYAYDGLAPRVDVRASWGASKQGALIVRFNHKRELVTFAQAFNELVARNTTDPGAKDFEARAEAWRAANPKPPLSESATKARILAENAARENNREAALRHFQSALATDPTWPAGNLNSALILADMGDYGAAIRYLKRFLLLEPDGRDSAAARQKLVIWEDKATHAPP